MAALPTTPKAPAAPSKRLLFAALITLALCTPIIMFRTDSDPNDGTLQLIFRPIAVLVFMALAFVGRLAVLTSGLRPARAKADAAASARRPGSRAFFSYVIGPLGLAVPVRLPGRRGVVARRPAAR